MQCENTMPRCFTLVDPSKNMPKYFKVFPKLQDSYKRSNHFQSASNQIWSFPNFLKIVVVFQREVDPRPIQNQRRRWRNWHRKIIHNTYWLHIMERIFCSSLDAFIYMTPLIFFIYMIELQPMLGLFQRCESCTFILL